MPDAPDEAQTAAEALIALGWPVEPHGDDLTQWRLEDMMLSDDELIAFAARQGVQVVGGEVQ